MTEFQKHKALWESCQRCPLWERRHKVVILRGKIPAQIMIVGEAPGQSEDSLGVPFIGPAGKLLDKILSRVKDSYEVGTGKEFPSMSFTNLVGCIPFEHGEDGVEKASEPFKEAIAACRPRVVDLAKIVRPKLVVMVGKLAGKHLLQDGNEFNDIGVVETVHPAYILRAQSTAQPLLIQRCIVAIRTAVEKYL